VRDGGSGVQVMVCASAPNTSGGSAWRLNHHHQRQQRARATAPPCAGRAWAGTPGTPSLASCTALYIAVPSPPGTHRTPRGPAAS
jgi:hypothetical protein